MTIRHLVIWKLLATDPAEKAFAIEEMRRSLEELAVTMPEHVMSLTVRPNAAYFDTNWDVVLQSEFASLADLEAYQRHPLHLAAGSVVSTFVASRSAIDIEL
jgi:hypothetical protein